MSGQSESNIGPVIGDGVLTISNLGDNDMANETGQPYDGNLSTSETLQAQQGLVNDEPTDVNTNAVVNRVQCATYTIHGSAEAGNSDRRSKMADHFMAILQAKTTGPLA